VGATHHAPAKPNTPTKAPTTTAIRAHLRLSGPLHVTGAPSLVAQTPTSSGGATAAQSSFTAPTDEGTFELQQSVTKFAGVGGAALITPSFVVGNVVERPAVTGSSSSVGVDANGNVTIHLAETAAPDWSTNAFPLSSLTADLVLTPDMSQVISEVVAVTAQPYVAPTPTTPTTPAGSPSTPSAGSAVTDGTES
jgi:hypothetical protein